MDYLDSWLDENGDILADAELVLTIPKIAISPYSDESRKILNDAGFTIYNKEQLSDIVL
jgi:DEAD/DEAH box helicase domain-containing protein